MNAVKKALLPLACAAALAGGSVAQAATVNLGPVVIGTPLPFSGFATPAGPFADVFTFSLPDNGGSAYSVVNFPLSLPGVGTFNTLFTSISLFSDPDGTPFNADDSFLATSSMAGPTATSLSLQFPGTSAGNMYLSVVGITNGTLGGLYSGAISASPVPVPPALWMLGSALVGLATVGRRKFA
jgi:hypothetical protein